mgnify:CR=1 FL=1
MAAKRHERTRARRSALALLYTSEITDEGATKIAEDGPLPDYATALVRGVEAHRVAIDKHLAATSENWALARMPIVDRSILRLATYEMMYVDDVPTSVTINEAVELAKDFGGEDESPRFVNGVLRLDRSQVTTQIEHYDNIAAIFDGFRRINTILIDMCRDIWTYVSMEYFKQKIKAGEVGSSAMPHKVNPIDFENAEGNLGIANAIFNHLSGKLPVSRLQRDLTDSTVLRNVGVPMAHTVVSFKSILKGLNKLIINLDKINEDLENNWAVVAEGIQTILRRESYPNPYEALKALTRTNKAITHEDIRKFIDTLDVSESVKEELRRLSPQTYTGVCNY